MSSRGFSVAQRLALVAGLLLVLSPSEVELREAGGRPGMRGRPIERGARALALRRGYPDKMQRKKPRARKPVKFNAVPLFVMLPLDTVSPLTGRLSDPVELKESLLELKRAGCKGVMGDVWWGIVEAEGPREYDWTGYRQLIEIVASVGLQFQAVMSFHQCGGNVGDACNIPLPKVFPL
jgi:hypothetical protein